MNVIFLFAFGVGIFMIALGFDASSLTALILAFGIPILIVLIYLSEDIIFKIVDGKDNKKKNK